MDAPGVAAGVGIGVWCGGAVVTSSATLARRTLGVPALLILGIVASSPMTVLVGGIPVTYAATGVAGVPLSFVVVMGVLGLLVVGYAGVSRRVSHTAPFFALLTLGLGGRAGMVGATVEFLGYNAIQISLYAFLGDRMSGLAGGAWWVWAAGAWMVITVFGLARMSANTLVLGGMLLVELSVIALFVIAAFTNPATGHLDAAPWQWRSLLQDGAGGALALTMAAFVGFECGPVFSEEARSPRAVMTATFTVAGCLGVLYAVLAWAVWTGVGPHVLTGGGDPSGYVFASLGRIYGTGVADLATLLLVTSVLAAMMSFHHVVSRNLFGLARERVLPQAITTVSTGGRGGVPVGGSLVQSATALLVIAGFVWSGADPIKVMFTWLSTVGALCILGLLVAASVAAHAYYRAGGGGHEGVFMRVVAPIIGALTGGLVVLFMASNLRNLLGLSPGSPLVWLLPAIVAAVAVTGWTWGGILRTRRPGVYARLGRGTPAPVTVLDHDLAELEV